ncbi:hypothetical protein PCH_Pc22g09980 [Penicillium rubens Wisconsin 54-1255]|uniref:Uncharacterized protein n=1 Tax=Penicillium rubens (strain ATCC 28089 / DSM 1075 / NRRL 1951 / Wisconsin 54-1255) TaxID=500485 RepID=B6HUX9_PENRW|nr:hypothetical protein PCH_Pc22g09980 [Penicillium rubens Wisconsin 54-1255]
MALVMVKIWTEDGWCRYARHPLGLYGVPSRAHLHVLGDVANYETWRDVVGHEVLRTTEWEMICEIGNSRSGPFRDLIRSTEDGSTSKLNFQVYWCYRPSYLGKTLGTHLGIVSLAGTAAT